MGVNFTAGKSGTLPALEIENFGKITSHMYCNLGMVLLRLCEGELVHRK